MDSILRRLKTNLLVYCKSHSNARTYKRIKESYMAGIKATAIYMSIVISITVCAAFIMDRKMGDNLLFIDEIEVSYTFLPVPIAILFISAWLIFTRYTVSKKNPMREYILFSRWYYSKDGDKEWYYGEDTEDIKSESQGKISKQSKNSKPSKEKTKKQKVVVVKPNTDKNTK